MARQMIPLPFGGGLDRYAGTTVAEPSSFRDLRNVYLREGAAELRKGLLLLNTLVGDDAVLAVQPIRSQRISAVLTYRASDHTVRLSILSGDASVAGFVAIVWTLDPAAAVRVSVTDSYSKLFIAHDEPTYALRQPTRVFDYVTGAVAFLTADLFQQTDPPTLVPVRFRGVARWLNYLVGWGYGTEVVLGMNDGQDDRPEIVRVSRAGDPLTFDPQFYFIAGQRGEAVLSCQGATQGLLVLKESDAQLITGYSAETFGIHPSDGDHGLVGSQMAATVGGTCYFWSATGPRVSDGSGPSQDLATLLDLTGPVADALATVVDPADGFAVFDSTARELLFCMGQWAVVLHLAEPNSLRWSYRQFGQALGCGGNLYLTGETVLGPEAHLEVVAITAPDPLHVSVEWNVVLDAGGALSGAEMWEVWGQPVITGNWVLLGTGPLATVVADTATVGDAGFILEGMPYDVAIRLRTNGVPAPAYASTDPSTWPASAQGMVTTPVDVPTLTGAWNRIDVDTWRITLTRAPAIPETQNIVSTLLEFSTDGGATWAAVPGTPIWFDSAFVHDTSAIAMNTVIQYRATNSTVYVAGATGPVLSILNGVAAPLSVAVDYAGATGVSVDPTFSVENAVFEGQTFVAFSDTGSGGGSAANNGLAFQDIPGTSVACGVAHTPTAFHRITVGGVNSDSLVTVGDPATGACA